MLKKSCIEKTLIRDVTLNFGYSFKSKLWPLMGYKSVQYSIFWINLALKCLRFFFVAWNILYLNCSKLDVWS